MESKCVNGKMSHVRSAPERTSGADAKQTSGTGLVMTAFAMKRYFFGCFLSQTLN
jgi:hypothetical protein